MPTDLSQRITHETLLGKATRSADQQSPRLDTVDFSGQMVVLEVDSHTDGTHDFALEVSDDGSSWRTPDSGQATDGPVVDGSSDTGTYYLSYLGTARYVRLAVTVSGSPSTGATYAAHGIAGAPDTAPVR